MQFYKGHIDDLKRQGEIRDVDADQVYSDHYGSWSFAKDEGKYTFLFLQGSFGPNNGAYDGEFFERSFPSGPFSTAERLRRRDFLTKNHYHFLSSESWLRNQLCRARNMGQTVILLTHSANAMSKVVKKRPELAAALTAAPILAIISGHLHDLSGKEVLEDTIAGYPVLYTGSPFYETYMDVEFKGDGTGLSYQVVHYDKTHIPADRIAIKPLIPAPMPTSAQCWVTPRAAPKECDTDSDCPRSDQFCDNSLIAPSHRCIAKRELGGKCFHHSTCASGNCHLRTTCRCQECYSKGCGGCGPDEYCASTRDFYNPWSWFGALANECRKR